MFGCNPQIIFVTFFSVWTKSFISSTFTRAYRHWISCKHSYSYNFSSIFMNFACVFCQGEFGSYSKIMFCSVWTEYRVIFAQRLPKNIDTWFLVNETPPTIYFEALRIFVTVCRCAWGVAVILFCSFTFFRLNLVIFGSTSTKAPGCVAQSVTCLATGASLTADPGVSRSTLASSHNFVEIDHEIIFTVNLLPSAESFKKGCWQLQAKVCARSTG